MTYNSHHSYPLMDHARSGLHTAGGKALDEVTLAALADGALDAADVAADAATLRRQAEIARAAGYGQLAENLTRAAELTAVPNTELLVMYEKLRPGRSTVEELLALAGRLEESYQAPATAAYVREAADVYRIRGLCKP